MSGGGAGRAILVAGTDTGVGKTVVSLLLLAALRGRGWRALGMKPVETGCAAEAPADALALAALSHAAETLEDLCPYRFALPVAPEAAARSEGAEVKLAVIRAALDRLRQRAEMVIVESAGGLGTPYAPGLLVLDIARELQLPVLLVAPDRLGTVGQTVLALRALAGDQVRCLGVLLCQQDPEPPGPEGATHAPLISAHGGGVTVIGRLPWLGEPAPPAGPALKSWASRHVATLESCISVGSLLAAADPAGGGRVDLGRPD